MGFLIFFGCAALLAMGILAGRTVLAAVSDGLVAQWRRMTPVGRVAASLAVGACVLYGGGKTRSAKGTPDRDVVRAANWNVRGAWEDSFDFDFAAGWVFPCGTNRLTGVEVFSQGYIRPLRSLITHPSSLITHPSSLITNNQPLADLGARVSIIPGVSAFSYEFTPSNSYRFIWNNVSIGRREANNQQPTSNNFSIDLFRSGDTLVVSNGVAAYRERVLPFDRDRDGILNEKDERPYIHDGDHFGNDNSLPEGANSNNYCWVDVVVADAAARVTFAGDGPSDYPDPDFVAMPGVAYRVALLIGKTYVVSCEESVSVVDRSSAEITVTSGADGLTIVWPVTYEIESFARSFSRDIRMLPPQLSGTFSWSTNACCAWVSDGSSSVPECTDDCSCGGCTLGSFTFHYEGYSLSFEGVGCSCLPQGVPEEDDGPYAASASVSFSKNAVIFENGYENLPGVLVPRKSTRTTLSCVAHGGPNGGVAAFSLFDSGKLLRINGATLPLTVDVPAGHKVEFDVVYEGLVASESEDDIVATAQFTDNEEGEFPEVADEITSIEVELEAVFVASENNRQDRHVYGVGEKVKFRVTPVLGAANISVEKADVGDAVTCYDTFAGDTEIMASAESIYTCPAVGGVPDITISLGNVEYSPDMLVVEPEYVLTPEAHGSGTFSLGQVGMGKLTTKNYIGPKIVSFQGVRFLEVPCDEVISPIGYYETTNYTGFLSHTMDAGAGYLHTLKDGNYWTLDEAGRDVPYQNWTAGRLEWKIPVGWRRFRFDGENFLSADDADYERHSDNSSRRLLIGNRSDMYKQIFVIEDDGTSFVSKFGYKLVRSRWRTVGTVQKE